ncbi:YslB family protein [Exiguobacterium artemiae]|uniref:YslB family protein n=1 Tax=Exiguobacterium sp. S22-S28 TaxID=3342768 RepID=UPI0011CB929B
MDSVPNTFGIELIRDYVLTDLLGTDYRHVIYWAGKRLARDFPVLSIEEVTPFFQEAGWGHLELQKQKGTSATFLLTPPESIRTERPTGYFQLEAGFLAEQFSKMNGCVAEGYAELVKSQVHIMIEMDPKDPIDPSL